MKALLERLSFAAGAVGKPLQVRLDLARSQVAVARAENVIVLVEGGLARRPGTRFVLEHADETQKAELVPFRYTGNDNYMIAINGGKARLLSAGGFVEKDGLPFEFQVPFAEADLPNVRWTADGNLMHLACDGHQTRELRRISHTEWALTLYETQNGPFETQNLDESKTLKASGVTGTITLSAQGHAPFVPADVGTIWRLDESDLSTVASWVANQKVVVGDLRRFDGNVYSVVAGTNSGVNAPTHTEGDVKSGGGGTEATWRYLHSGFGHVKVTQYVSAASVTGNVVSQLPNSITSKPTYRWLAPAWSDTRGWPKLVYRYQQRLVLLRGPQFWFSTVLNPADHQQGIEDDQAIAGRLRSQDGSLVDVQALLASGALVAFSRDGEWALRASNVVDAVTVTNLRPIPETSEGSAPHVPVAINGGAITIGRSRKRIHFIKFDRTSEGVEAIEITISNRRILKGLATHLAYQHDPHHVCWIGCADGSLVGCTWMPEQQVIGLHIHPLKNGYVESIRAMPSNDEGVSEVYMSVRRTINGQTRRYYEQLADFFEPLDDENPTAEGAWFLDCAIRYQGAPTTTIGGLSHLEGESVNVFGGGRWIAQGKVVTNGSITGLSVAVTDAIVGLPISYRIKSLPTEWPAGQQGSSAAKQKTASKVLVRVVDSHGGKISVNGGPKEALSRSGAAGPGAVPLTTGKLFPTTEANHDRDLVWEITGDDPFPFTLVGVGPDADAEEGSA